LNPGESGMSTGEIFAGIAIGVFFLIVIVISLIFSVSEWSDKVMGWLRGKKKPASK